MHPAFCVLLCLASASADCPIWCAGTNCGQQHDKICCVEAASACSSCAFCAEASTAAPAPPAPCTDCSGACGVCQIIPLPKFNKATELFHAGSWHDHWYSELGMLSAFTSRITSTTRVAVVGSSGNMMFRHHGREIDGHDVVVRINAAPTEGHESDVGSTTHIRIGWMQGYLDAVRGRVIQRDELLVLTAPNSHMGEPEWEFPWHGDYMKYYNELNSLKLPEHRLVSIKNGWAAAIRPDILNNEGELQSHTQCTAPSAFSAQCTTQAAALCMLQASLRRPGSSR